MAGIFAVAKLCGEDADNKARGEGGYRVESHPGTVDIPRLVMYNTRFLGVGRHLPPDTQDLYMRDPGLSAQALTRQARPRKKRKF